MNTEPNLEKSGKPRLAAWARFLLFAPMLSLPVITYAHNENPIVAVWCFLICTMAGVVLQSWLIICTLLGVFCGALFQPLVGYHSAEERAWAGFWTFAIWAALGVLAGFLADAAKHQKHVPARNSTAESEAGRQEEHWRPS
jgi:hypothetical protein